MLSGLQTHFGAPLGSDLCLAIATLGVKVCRIAPFDVDPLPMIAEVEAAGMQALVIVDRPEQMRTLPLSAWVELGNELDGDVKPDAYRAMLDEACAIAIERGQQLWAPAISNISQGGLKWLNAVKGSGWPAGLTGITAHSYGPFPHAGFSSRDAEVKWLKAACDGLPFAITECGLASTDGVTEAEQAAFYVDEWAFWQRHGAAFAIAFQLNDGLGTGNEQNFGIRRVDGTWKPSALTFPTQETEENDMRAMDIYPESWLIPGETPGTLAIRKPNGKQVSVDPNGTVGESDNVQSYESGLRSGNELVYHAGSQRPFALPIAVGL